MGRDKISLVHTTRKSKDGEPFRTSVSPRALPGFLNRGWVQEEAEPTEAKPAKRSGAKTDDPKKPAAQKAEGGEEGGGNE